MKCTEEQKDIMREIGNIGGGNALTSLSAMLGLPLELEVPECCIVSRGELGGALSNPDMLYAGVKLEMTGTVECILALLMNRDFTQLVVGALDEDEPFVDVGSLTPMQQSALCEVGNIMGNSYVTALGALFDMQINTSVPYFMVDTGRRVLSSFLESQVFETERLLFVSTSFSADSKMLESHMLLWPSNESLNTMLSKAGA